MATWVLGDDSFKVEVTAVETVEGVKFTVKILAGTGDINALWWGDDTSNDAVKLDKKDNSLNMNGTDGDFNYMHKFSDTGLKDGPALDADSPPLEFTWNGGSLDDIGDIGIRATSVNGGDSVKLVAHEPVDESAPDDFPDSFDFGISHITLYYDVDSVADGADAMPGGNRGGPDGVYTVKIDDVPGDADQDLDGWIDAVMQYLIENDDNIDAGSDLLGVAIKYGNNEDFFAYGSHNANGTDPDPVDPAGPFAEPGQPPYGGSDSSIPQGEFVHFTDLTILYSELGIV